MERRYYLIAALLIPTAVACGQVSVPTPQHYELPQKATEALAGLASETDVLMLGETHGTQEVPAVAAALLAPLSKLGYGVLALEIPSDQRQPLIDWAAGKTTKVPPFFTKPLEWEDGRGNVQLLSLIRTALATPYQWQLICFDQARPIDYDAKPTEEERAIPDNPDDLFTEGVKRDAEMATNLAKERLRLAPDSKVLVICGNMHARTANHQPPDNPLSKLWPSLAGALVRDHSTWRIRSIRVEAHAGEFFAMMGSLDDLASVGKVHKFRSKRQFAEAEAHPLEKADWNWELNLPRSTAATFLSTPSTNTSAASPSATTPSVPQNAELRTDLLQRVKKDQEARNALIQWTKEHGHKIDGAVKQADFTDDQKAEFALLQAATKIDEDNTAWLKQLVDAGGWPTTTLVGKDGAHAAWLLVQHADHNPRFQRQCLDLMAVLPKGEVSQTDIAYLTDRVLLKEGKKQLYGTQFTSEDGKWKPQPLEDEANVDARRAEAGLPSLAEYAKQLEAVYGGKSK